MKSLTWINLLKVSKSLGILVLIIGSVAVGYWYTQQAYQNWINAKTQVMKIINEYENLNFGNNTDQKFGRWNETIQIRNEIDRTFFNALRDGFFGVGGAISIATLLLSFDVPSQKEERNMIELTKAQLNDIIALGGVGIDLATRVKIIENSGNPNKIETRQESSTPES